MLVYGLDNETFDNFYFFKKLEIKKEINELDILSFEIPKEYRNIFNTECQLDENKQSYTIKNIEPFYDCYKIECKQDIDEWLSFFHKSVNFPYKDIETMIKGIIPNGWSYVIIGEIKKYRTITADHKSSWEVFEEIVKKFDVEYRLDNKEKKIFISEKIGEDKGAFFSDDFNIVDKDISVESFEFATRIIPEGMNGLKINQINDGKDYLENKSYSGKTIIYYWKDERYTNIQNLKDEAERKLEVLSRPRITIKLKVKDLSKAIGVYEQEYSVGDYVYLIDKDRKTKERFRILAETTFPNRPFNNEITLANKPLDLLDDVDENIELTKEMWEETRGRFEATDELIKGYLEKSKRYTDDSFKTYKSEREQTDSKIYESISESTTYVDPETGQTKPIIDKQLEVDKTVEGININVYEQKNSLDKLSSQITQTTKEISAKVSNGELSSFVRQEFDKYTVQARNINFDGSYVNVKGSFQTIGGDNDVGIKIDYNDIVFRDYRGNGTNYGSITVVEDKDSNNDMSLNIGHFKTGHTAIRYWVPEEKVWRPYVAFDKWYYTNRKSGYPITFYEGVDFLGNVHFPKQVNFDCVRIRTYSDAIGIESFDGKAGLVIKSDGSVYIKDAKGSRRLYVRE